MFDLQKPEGRIEHYWNQFRLGWIFGSTNSTEKNNSIVNERTIDVDGDGNGPRTAWNDDV